MSGVPIEWRGLRPWRGSQHHAFEELCAQLAAAEPPVRAQRSSEKQRLTQAWNVTGVWQVGTSGRGKLSSSRSERESDRVGKLRGFADPAHSEEFEVADGQCLALSSR